MKLHDPATERELLRLATHARKGGPIQPHDRKEWGGLLGPLISSLFIGYLISGILGATNERLRAEHWFYLIGSVVLTWTAQIGLGTLIGTFNHSHHRSVLINLPIRGEHALRWIRSRFLTSYTLVVIAISAICSFASFGFSFDSPWKLAANILLLTATVFATIVLQLDQRIQRLRASIIWNVVSLMMAGWMIVLAFTHKKIFRIGGTPEWMEDGIMNLTWIFPPSWCMPGRFENGGALISAIWIVWGIHRWMTWPKTEAHHFDAPQDFVGNQWGHFDEDEGDECEFPPSNSLSQDVEEDETQRFVCLPEPLALPQGAWVDRWILSMLGPRHAVLAGALADSDRSWSRKTNLTIISLPFLILAAWSLSTFFRGSQWSENLHMWIWISAIVWICVGLLPFTNAVPRATEIQCTGSHGLPVFATLPVNALDVLRISMRITIARCLVMGLIATPFFWIFLAILSPSRSPWEACWLVPAICCFWASSRPIFVAYRMQSTSRRRRGVGFINAILLANSLILTFVWLASALIGIFSGLGFFWEKSGSEDTWTLLSLAFGGLITSGLCARAVFEIHRWQLVRNHRDLLSSAD